MQEPFHTTGILGKGQGIARLRRGVSEATTGRGRVRLPADGGRQLQEVLSKTPDRLHGLRGPSQSPRKLLTPLTECASSRDTQLDEDSGPAA